LNSLTENLTRSFTVSGLIGLNSKEQGQTHETAIVVKVRSPYIASKFSFPTKQFFPLSWTNETFIGGMLPYSRVIFLKTAWR